MARYVKFGMMAAVLFSAMVPLGVEAQGTQSQDHIEMQGMAVFYNPGVMERVAARRGLRKPINVQGYASTTECSNIGKTAYASINGGMIESYLIVDCSQPYDRARHVAEHLVLEVDWPSAVRNHFNAQGHAPAVVYTVGGHIGLRSGATLRAAKIPRP